MAHMDNLGDLWVECTDFDNSFKQLSIVYNIYFTLRDTMYVPFPMNRQAKESYELVEYMYHTYSINKENNECMCPVNIIYVPVDSPPIFDKDGLMKDLPFLRKVYDYLSGLKPADIRCVTNLERLTRIYDCENDLIQTDPKDYVPFSKWWKQRDELISDLDIILRREAAPPFQTHAAGLLDCKILNDSMSFIKKGSCSEGGLLR
jgi:hypothetical protein